jgi:type IV secretory pathway VirB3-like protein
VQERLTAHLVPGLARPVILLGMEVGVAWTYIFGPTLLLVTLAVLRHELILAICVLIVASVLTTVFALLSREDPEAVRVYLRQGALWIAGYLFPMRHLSEYHAQFLAEPGLGGLDD